MLRRNAPQSKLQYVSLPQKNQFLSPAQPVKNNSKPADTTSFLVARIDAVQAEYSAFETLHETDGLIATARELNIAYVAYSPLGHGWLVDDFPYETPDDFAPDDFRRTGKLLSVPLLSSLATLAFET